MDVKDIKKIAEQYPERIEVHPRSAFINQLTKFLIKYQEKLK